MNDATEHKRLPLEEGQVRLIVLPDPDNKTKFFACVSASDIDLYGLEATDGIEAVAQAVAWLKEEKGLTVA